MRIDTHNELASAQRALEELVGDSLRVEAIEGAVEMSPAGDWRSHNLTRGWPLAADVVLTAEVVSPANVAEHGSADAYLASRSRHNAANAIVWLAGVEEHRISWWTGGQLADASPEWAAALTVSAWEISG